VFESARHILSRVAPDDRILLAVSGGADSFAMLKWFASQEAWRRQVVTAHVNHRLREDAGNVVTLVAKQAESLKIPFVLAEVDVLAAIATRNESVEACARRLRYAALEEIRVAHDCAYIATAHTQDDDAETVLMKLNMNSSWYECTGIPIQRGRVLRPLLGVSRTELRSLISQENEYDSDPMNEDLRFLRVQSRAALKDALEVTNQLRKHGKQVQRLLSLTSRLIKANDNIYLSDCFSRVSGLEKLPKNLYLEDLDFLAVELGWAGLIGQSECRMKSALRRKVLEFLKAGDSRATLPLPGDVELHRAGQQVWLRGPLHHDSSLLITQGNVVLTPDAFRSLEAGVLSLASFESQAFGVRTWVQGERFKPATRCSRKISDWLAEGGVHPAVRAQWPVICLDDVIIAVPGLGVAEHVKPRGDTPVVNIYWKAHFRRDQQVSR